MSTLGALEKTAYRCGEVGVQPVYTRAAAEAQSSADFFTTFTEGFQLNVLQESPDELEFEMIGIEASLANALRRILVAEVPTVAIETVYYTRNTGIVQDEVLAHRLGLVPLNIDPREVEMMGRELNGAGYYGCVCVCVCAALCVRPGQRQAPSDEIQAVFIATLPDTICGGQLFD